MSRTRRVILGLSILAVIILTLASLFEMCTEECQEGHNYRIFGMPFEWFGLIVFIPAAVLFWLKQYRLLGWIYASSLGGELVFIGYQKYVIGVWCPVCLGIATCVFVGCGALSYDFFENLLRGRGSIMSFIRRGATSFIALCIGFTAALTGITKYDAMEAAENNLKNEIAFGNVDSEIQVYLFTDWACPACRKLEPILPVIVNGAAKESKFTFVDHVIHPETLNYIPYNLSFMVNNKKDYLKIRHVLTELSEKTGSPEEEDVEHEVSRIGVTYEQLDYADVALGIQYFKELGAKFKVKGTPTLVIINTQTKKGKKLQGTAEITDAKIRSAIEELKKS